MQPEPTPSEPDITAPAITAEEAIDNTRHSAHLLRSLMDKAHDLATMVHQKAVATAMDAATDGRFLLKTEDFTIPFERAARTARRCIILLESLAQPRPTGYDVALAAQKRAARQRALNEGATRLQPVEREPRERSDTEMVERAERVERVEDEFGNEFHTRPMAEIITEICADLGIDPPSDMSRWSNRTFADIAAGTPSAAGTHAAAGLPRRPPPDLIHPPEAPPDQTHPTPLYPLRR